ncbi:hypothetical protein CL634_03120 [bacterium]|nr:hypothetical protein [bacterium]|tara:strand:+ start:52 stop:237 length:186 start_codon:yes stop_codon:yes gene_type:complete
MKFYEVKQQLNNLRWLNLGYFRKKEDAEKYEEIYKASNASYPIKIEEKEFSNIKDFEKGKR